MSYMERVVVLNSDYSFLSTIHWKRAINLVLLGKVEVLKKTDRIIKSINLEIAIPSVVKLIKFIRKIYTNKVPWSRKNVIYRDRNMCQYCGDYKPFGEITIDHIVPSSRGGKDTFENCVACCKYCNNFKGNRTPNEAQMSLKRKPFSPTIMEFITIKLKTLGIDKLIEETWEY